MNYYEYQGAVCTIKDLSEKSGVAEPTIRDRLRRGYSLEESLKPYPTLDSIKEFAAASDLKDWVGMSITNLHNIYWKWSLEHGYKPITQVSGFTRQLRMLYPQIHTVPTKGNDDVYKRIIRLR